MKGFKGFDKDLKCRDLQYEVGKEAAVDGDIKLCKRGIHFCENPHDVFNHYAPGDNNRFAVVEAEDVSDERNNDDSKRVYIAHTDSEVGLIVSIRLTSSNDMKSEMAEIKNENLSNTESIGKNLKPFDLQAAKSGKPVCTRDGRKARIICFDAKCNLPIIALVTNTGGNESLIRYYSNGSFTNLNKAGCDLMMLSEKKEGWAVIRRSDIYENEEQVKEALLNSHTAMMVGKITWEE